MMNNQKYVRLAYLPTYFADGFSIPTLKPSAIFFKQRCLSKFFLLSVARIAIYICSNEIHDDDGVYIVVILLELRPNLLRATS